MKRYKHLFIDLDDTIWDFRGNAKSALHDLYLDEKLFYRFQDFESFYTTYVQRNLELWTLYGKGKITKDYLSIERFRYPLKQIGINDDRLADKMNSIYLDTLATKTLLMPYAKELLKSFADKKIPVTLISNGFVEVQHKKLRNANIERYFTHIVLSETVGALKPNPEIFRYALELNNASNEEVLMVGDSFDADVIGAVSSNIDVLFYNPAKIATNIGNNICGYTEITDLRVVESLF